MATKKIVASVTLHVPATGHMPFKFDAFSNRTAGAYKIEEIAPGTPVDLDGDEADALIAAGKAELFEEPKVEAAKAPAK